MVYSDMKEMFRDAKDFATGANDLQLKQILSDIQGKVYELQEENRDLREEIENLKNIDIVRGELKKKGNAYYKADEGPYCLTCFDSEGKLVNLILSTKTAVKFKIGRCSKCQTEDIQTEEENLKYDEEVKKRQQRISGIRNY